MRGHSDKIPPWRETTLTRNHPDEKQTWWEMSLRGYPDKIPAWWDVILMRTPWQDSETTLMRDHPDERPPWWEASNERLPWWQTTLTGNQTSLKTTFSKKLSLHASMQGTGHYSVGLPFIQLSSFLLLFGFCLVLTIDKAKAAVRTVHNSTQGCTCMNSEWQHYCKHIYTVLLHAFDLSKKIYYHISL